MTGYHLAVDIGASSGRHILGWLDHGKLRLHLLTEASLSTASAMPGAVHRHIS